MKFHGKNPACHLVLYCLGVGSGFYIDRWLGEKNQERNQICDIPLNTSEIRNSSVYKFYWNTATLTGLHNVYGCFAVQQQS